MDAIYLQVGATSPYGIVAGERIALALIKGTNLRGIVALTVHFERRAQEHFRRELFDGVPDRFGGPGKAPIPQPRTAFRREQLGRCRVVEGGHKANIDLFRKRCPHLESIGEIQRLLGPRSGSYGQGHATERAGGLRLLVHPAVVVVLAAHTLPVHGDSGDCWRLNDDIMDGRCRQWLRLHLMDGTAQLGERRGAEDAQSAGETGAYGAIHRWR